MKTIFATIAILIVILTACGKAAVDKTQQEADQMVEQAKQLLPKTQPTTTPSTTKEPSATEPTSSGVEASQVQLPADIQKLLDTAKKVKSYQYQYSQTPNLKQLTPTKVKGTRVRLELYQPPRYDPATYYNVVYIDTQTKTAAAYCEDSLRCRDRINARVNVDYLTYEPKLSEDWLNEIDVATAQVLQTQTIDQRPAKRIQYEKDGNTVDMWLDETYGLPLKVVINTPEPSIYQYGKLVANTVTDDELKEPLPKSG